MSDGKDSLFYLRLFMIFRSIGQVYTGMLVIVISYSSRTSLTRIQVSHGDIVSKPFSIPPRSPLTLDLSQKRLHCALGI